MSRKLLLVFSLAAVWVPFVAMAQVPPAQQPPAQQPAAQQPAAQTAAPFAATPAKIAWLNVEQAIISCDEGKAQFTDVQKYVDSKNSDLEKLKKLVDALQNQLNVQGPKLTDDARADLEEQLQTATTQLQRFSDDTQKDIDSRRNRVTNYVGRRMLPVIEKLAKERGLSAVVYFNPQRDAWVEPTLLITDDIVKAYNRAYPVAAKPAAAAPTKP
jgi:Skp family chaperone for outer membrane proteins